MENTESQAKIVIFLDLDGVVFEPIEHLVIKAALKKHGYAKGGVLLACYKLGIFKDYVVKNVSNIVYDYAVNAPFIKGETKQTEQSEGAMKQVERLVNQPGIVVEVCSKINWGVQPNPGETKQQAQQRQTARLEEYYRGMAPCMNKIEKYNLLGVGQSKADIFIAALEKAKETGDRIFAVDDKAKNFKGVARIPGMNAILVSKKGKEISQAREFGVTRRLPTLFDFVGFISHENHHNSR